MSMTKYELLLKALRESRKIEFIFKKDGTLRSVEPYVYYTDEKRGQPRASGAEKLWCYQPDSMLQARGGPRVFFVEDMTYMKLGDEFNMRRMKPAPNVGTELATIYEL